MVSILLIGFFVVLALLLLSMIVFGYMFFMKKAVKVRVLMPTNRWRSKRFMNPGARVHVDDCAYYVRETAEIKTFWGSEINYFYNIPEPIVYDKTAYKPTFSMNGQEIKSAVESEIWKQIFSTDNIKLLTFIVLCVVLVAVVIDIFISKSAGSAPVQLGYNISNYDFITGACKAAVRGVA